DRQIRHYFLSGYTAKVAGTERGVTEPQPIFSTCFASPFLVLPPERYADMLIERVKRPHADVWMLNTGWVGGPYGIGERMSIAHTRAIVHAVLEGKLRGVSTHEDPIFKLQIPDHVPHVPREVLDPRGGWPDPDDYDRQAAKLRWMFEENIQKIGSSTSTTGG
ncbi:MAG TPA: phosphoenolpyruvate carboxykinase (ATP), partial [Patescibacteria group bacterium]|nr:phosphoenolpyruvate carboxykinase (ATP) [Patescibacteria group bacterium]